MTPKPKLETPKVREPITEKSWRPALDSVHINDDHWWCMITMIIETLPEQSQYVSILNEAAEHGNREAVFSLSYEKLINSVRALSREDPQKCSIIQGICHYANSFLDQEPGCLPSPLIARLIKYMVYRSKEKTISRMRRKLELEQDIERELGLMQTVLDVEAHSFTNKTNTRLRKRGEEWRDQIFIDDAPENGPNLYVVLTGFHDPNLPSELIDAGVPLTCILKIKTPSDEIKLGDDDNYKSVYDKHRFIPSIQTSDLNKFWRELENHLKDPERSEEFGKLIVLTFCPPEIDISNIDQNMMKDIYDRISFISYDLYELCRQHVEYLSTMKLQIVDEERPVKQDISSYENNMADISEESATVFIVLKALLTQVEQNLNPAPIYEENSIENPSCGIKISKIPSDSGSKLLNNQMRSHHDSSILGESRTDASSIPLSFMERLMSLNSKHEVITAGDADNDESHHISCPKLILYQDSHQLGREQQFLFDTNSIYPEIGALWNQNPLKTDLQERYAYHINMIAESLEKKLDNITLYHYLNLLALQNILQTKGPVASDKKSDFGENLTYQFECLAFCSLAATREILQPGPSEVNYLGKYPLSEFEDVELLAAPVFQQTLQKCFEEYGYSQMYYFEPTDTVLIFFSQMDNPGVVERVESGILPTPICFREFCKNVSENWEMRAQEGNRNTDLEGEKMLESDQRTQFKEDHVTLRDENFILPTSLKAEVLRKVHQQPMDERKPKIREDEIVSGRGSKKGEKPLKKGESAEGKKKKSIKEKVFKERILDTPLDTSFLSKREKLEARCAREGEAFKSIGYDLGEHEIKVSCVRKSFYSIDGTNVNVDLETGVDLRKLLRIGIINLGCRLQLHSVIDEGCLYSMFPFHFTTPEGLIIAFTKLHDNNRKPSETFIDTVKLVRDKIILQ